MLSHRTGYSDKRPVAQESRPDLGPLLCLGFGDSSVDKISVDGYLISACRKSVN